MSTSADNDSPVQFSGQYLLCHQILYGARVISARLLQQIETKSRATQTDNICRHPSILEFESSNSILGVPSFASKSMCFSSSFSVYLLLSLSFIRVAPAQAGTPIATMIMTLVFPTSEPFVSSMTSWTKLSRYRYQMLKMGGPARVPEALTRTLLRDVPPRIDSH